MSLSKYALVGAAAAVVLAEPAAACMQFSLTKKDLAVIGIIGTITMPLWIVPALGYGAVVGIQAAAEEIKESTTPSNHTLANKNGEWWRRRTEQLQPLLVEAEKNPTPQTLMRIGSAFYQNSDLMNARAYLRRAAELAEEELAKLQTAKQQQEGGGGEAAISAMMSLQSFSLFTLGVIKQRMRAFADATKHFQDARKIVERLSATAAPSSPSSEKAAAVTGNVVDNNDKSKDDGTTTTANHHHPPAQQPKHAEGAVVLDPLSCLGNEGWTLLHATLYRNEDPSPLPAGGPEADDKDVLKFLADGIDTACDQLRRVFEAQPTTDLDATLRYAIARYYQTALPLRRSFLVGSQAASLPNYKDGDEHDPKTSPAFQANVVETSKLFRLVLEADRGALDTPGSPTSRNEDLATIRATAASYLSQLLILQRAWDDAEAMQDRAFALDHSVHLTPISKRRWASSGRVEKAIIDLKTDAPFRIDNKMWMPYPLGTDDKLNCGTDPHNYVQRKFHRPSWCDVCNDFISWSENQEAWECTMCNHRFHQECKSKVGSDQMCPEASNVSLQGKLDDHQHILRKKNLHHPTFCSFCNKYIWNPRAAFKCEACGIIVHEDCTSLVRNALVAPETK